MGETKLQKNIFTLMMCFGMVLGMTIYNMLLHNGYSSHFFLDVIKEIWIVYVVALSLDVFIVGPFAKKFVFSIVPPDTKKIFVILSIASTMVVSMVILMSIFGSIMSAGFTLKAFKIYPKTVLLNFIVALPLNLLVVSPIVRTLFVKIFPQTVPVQNS